MKSVFVALLLLAAALAASGVPENSVAIAPMAEGHEPELDEESDSAPFMIVVEHSSGRRCGGSLVSLRTALTSAWCAGASQLWALAPAAGAGQLWALAPGSGARRRVARVALAAGADVDVALLELEAPFGGGAHSRPILMATQPSECTASSTCHVVRALGPEPRLRIVDARLVPGGACAEGSLCLVGPTLCSADRGAGVVCEGKLCGVLSRSARAGGAAQDACGDTHVAQSVARWRRFLHCSHTLRACGGDGGGDCSSVCSERRLVDADSADSAATLLASQAISTGTGEPPAEFPASIFPTPTHVYSAPRPELSSLKSPTRSTWPHSEPALTSSSPQASPRPSFEFEPNRPDFKGGPARTSRVFLKAGEYGDNAAEYGGEEALLLTSSESAATSASTTPAGPSAPAGPAAPAGPEAPAGPAAPAAPAGPEAPAGPAAPAGFPGPAAPGPAGPAAITMRVADVQARVSPAPRPSRTTRPDIVANLLYALLAITIMAN